MAWLLGLCAIWGLGQVAIKVSHAGISPLTQAGLRSAIATVCLVAWAAVRGIPLVRRDGSLGYGVTIALAARGAPGRPAPPPAQRRCRAKVVA